MANILSESVTVSLVGGLVHVDLRQIHDDGIDLGGPLVFEASAAPWLAGEVERASDPWGFAEVDQTVGPDHFTIYIGGSDMQPFVHVHNQRDPDAALGKVYALGMTTEAARSLAEQLRAVS